MQILATLFIDDISMRETSNSLTRIDLTGVQFTTSVSDDFPLVIAPHLVVLIHSEAGGTGSGVLEVTYQLNDVEIARNVQPLQIQPSQFAYRLIRAELELNEPSTVYANCRIDTGNTITIPYTVEASA